VTVVNTGDATIVAALQHASVEETVVTWNPLLDDVAKMPRRQSRIRL